MLRYFWSTHRFYEADPGTPTGGNLAPEPMPATGNDPAPKPEKAFTQSDVDAIVKDRLERAKRKADDEATKAKSEADAKALAEQGEWKTLAEQRQAEITTLTATVESQKAHEKTIERLTTVLKSRLEVDRKGLPQHIIALLDRLDVADQMEWLATNLDALKVADTKTAGTPPRNVGSKGQPVKIELPERKYTL
jgi:hypothetical protein